jgi:hypothetical protein
MIEAGRRELKPKGTTIDPLKNPYIPLYVRIVDALPELGF